LHPSFRTVLFDCDSTLSSIEGIDELGREFRDRIVPLTDAAMRGEVPLESVYARRLAIIRPSQKEVERVGRLYVERLVPGAVETVAALQRAGVQVRILSGGLRPAVMHVARALGVGEHLVHAVDVTFDAAGAYAGFEEDSPLTRDGGKPAVIASLGSLARATMLVGDGHTDLEARPLVDAFIAFASVVERPRVVAGADAVVRANSLLPVLALALGEGDALDRETRNLMAAGRAMLDGAPPLPPLTGRSPT